MGDGGLGCTAVLGLVAIVISARGKVCPMVGEFDGMAEASKSLVDWLDLGLAWLGWRRDGMDWMTGPFSAILFLALFSLFASSLVPLAPTLSGSLSPFSFLLFPCLSLRVSRHCVRLHSQMRLSSCKIRWPAFLVMTDRRR